MSAVAEKILAEVLQLPEPERVDLVDKLVDSLNSADEADWIHPDWKAEIERRIADIDSGRVQLVPWAEVLGMLRSDEQKHAGVGKSYPD